MDTRDSLDDRLITLIGEDPRQSSKTIAQKLGVSPATVRRRLSRLIKSGVLHFVAAIDPAQFLGSTPVVIAFDVDRNRIKYVVEILKSLPEVKWVATTTGRFDILATAYIRDNNALSEFLEESLGHIEGVRDSETFICMDVKKGRLLPVNNI